MRGFLSSAPVRAMLEDICRIVLHAAYERVLRQERGDPATHAMDYYRAMLRVLGVKGEDAPSNPYDSVVRELIKKRSPPVKEHTVLALLIAASLRLRYGTALADRAFAPWAYFSDLALWCEQTQHPWVQGFVLKAARKAAQGDAAIAGSIGVADRRPAGHAGNPLRAIHDPDARGAHCAELWRQWRTKIRMRLRMADGTIAQYLDAAIDSEWSVLEKRAASGEARALTDLPEFRELRERRLCGTAPDLEELVELPAAPAPSERTLLRYLWGAGLLGAEHLQYPENILLAAHDLVAQNAADYVVYTEVRCETPGYTKAGMDAELVTDLLCAAFDLAALHQADHHRKTFVRTNLLLAAKRHKSAEERERVISLLAAYLARKDPLHPLLHIDQVPAWWRPAQVVGFDLSGNEAVSPQELRQQIARLAEHSSDITVHAGEAASAESIWQAVYEYHARRIGHGLRLRERGKLLQFCINEGICMEMCPISNKFTSDFVNVGHRDDYHPHWLEHYPLRHFMDMGLEVCINTDNRSLHGKYGGRLTDEYLWAARLSGGFTRWEVLKLVKAGFKHAFLDKRDVQEILQAAETWMFSHVTTAPGLAWQPRRATNGEA